MKLRKWLDEQGMSAYRLCQQLGYSQALVSMMINGKRSASADFRLKMLETFGIDEYRKIFEQDYITKIFDMAMEYLSESGE